MSQQPTETGKKPENIEKAIISITDIAHDLERKKQEFRSKAKYKKIEYEKLCKENTALEKQIASLEKAILKMETKLPDSIKLMESVKKSLIIADNVENHLIQYRDVVRENETQWAEKFKEKDAYYESIYQEMREAMESSCEEYKIYQRELNEEKAVEIQNRILLKKVEEQEQKIALRKDINHKLFISKIVNFAKGVTMLRRNNIIDKEIAEKKIIINSLTQVNQEPTHRLVPFNRVNPFDDILSRAKNTSFCSNLSIVRTTVNQVPIDANHKESTLLKDLKERLNKGNKLLLHPTDSSSSLKSISQQYQQPMKRNNAPSIENPSAKKIKIVQDITLPALVQKPSNIPKERQVMKKPSKKVSFAVPQQIVNATEENPSISRQSSFTIGNNKLPFFKPNTPVNSIDETTQGNFLLPSRMQGFTSSKYKRHEVPDLHDLNKSRPGLGKPDDTNFVDKSRSSLNFLESTRMQGFMSTDFNTNKEVSVGEEVSDLDVTNKGLDETVLSAFEREDEAGPYNNDFSFNFGFGGGHSQASSTGPQFFF